MIKNYLLSTLRNLRKHLGYSLINIFGLGLGLSITLLLTLWIKHELSYDKFHAQAENLYRVSVDMSFAGRSAKLSASPTALLPALEKNFEEVKEGVRIYDPAMFTPFIVKKGEHLYEESNFYYADSAFFNVFSYKLLKGNPDKALTEPRSLVITASTAKKYFGDEEALGQDLLVNGKDNYVVTGVMEDNPSNSYLRFDFIGSFSSIRPSQEENQWFPANYSTFVTLMPGADLNAIRNKTNDLVKTAIAGMLPNPSDKVEYSWTKLTDLHLRSEAMSEMETVSSIQYVYLFSAIALLVLLIACINYVNLATARASFRAKEVGVRKVVGAQKRQLIFQFIGESVIITLIAFVFAFMLAQLLLPLFNNLTGKELSHLTLVEPQFLLTTLIVLVFISIAAGSYPALAITAFKPVNILKGKFTTSAKGIWLRKSLVVFQFGISIVLIIGTVAIIKQLSFIQSRKLGYEKENVIAIPLDTKTEEVFMSLKNEFLRSGKVLHLARATESPVEIKGGYSIGLRGAEDQAISVVAAAADEEYIPALGMEIIAGRNFTEGDFLRLQSDTTYSFILNETVLKNLFLSPEEAIGKQATMHGRNGEIVGVVRDFHFASLHQPIGPLVLFTSLTDYNYMVAKLAPGDITETLSTLEKISSEVAPHRPFTYQFVDQQYGALYFSEQRMGTLFGIFASLAIVIACLGLLGLVSFSATQRTKEIGIRKVLGATASHILVLITREYTVLLGISIVIGIPLAIYLSDFVLGNFAYRTTLGAVPVLVAVVGCVAVAFATASYQAIKAALINPTETLRNE